MKPLPLEDKERKALPIFKWLTEYFPDAIVECVKLSVAGNIQHNPELKPEDITWAREKSTQQMDTAFRHMWDHKAGIIWDKDGCYHLAKAAWRILAELQLTIENVEDTQQENAWVFEAPSTFTAGQLRAAQDAASQLLK